MNLEGVVDIADFGGGPLAAERERLSPQAGSRVGASSRLKTRMRHFEEALARIAGQSQ